MNRGDPDDLNPHHGDEDHGAAAGALLDKLLEHGTDIALKRLGLTRCFFLAVFVLESFL